MKTIIIGPENISDSLLKEAIESSTFKISRFLIGASDLDKLTKIYAKSNSIPVDEYTTDWNNIKAQGATVKVNKWGKKYNSRAGFMRNSIMAEDADLLISFKESDDLITQMKKLNKTVYYFNVQQKKEPKYVF